MTQNNDKTIQWTSFNKLKRFTKAQDTTNFVYGPNRARYLKTQRNQANTTYIGKLFEQISSPSKTQTKHFIYAGGQLITIHTKTETKTLDTNLSPITAQAPDQTRYLHYDNLGSIDTITDGQGNVVERMSYAAFGERRKADWRVADPCLPIIPKLTNRGFTGHEHIDEMGLIHMNGRVYDPQIGRFLSADPHIQAPYNTQSYNRYTYALNNPLKYTDPSGYFILGFIPSVITQSIVTNIAVGFIAQVAIAYAVSYAATGSAKASQGAGLTARWRVTRG